MDKTRFLTIYPSFERLEVVRRTLPSVIAETKRNDARLLVHDSSVKSREEKWRYLQEANRDSDFFLLLSDDLSMAHARNACLHLGQELFAPDYICLVEDDHGYAEGFIPEMLSAMAEYYGKAAPNGLRYGLFTGCAEHNKHAQATAGEDGHLFPLDQPALRTGRANSCCRCAPTSHWSIVLKGYDTDEYPISTYQTRGLNLRNYHRGFTMMVVGGGRLMFNVEDVGRGYSLPKELRGWDEEYTASDPRSRYPRKPKG